MRLLTLELAERLFALPALQVEAVAGWPPPVELELPRTELALALGIPGVAPSERLLVLCDEAGRRVGFGVPASLRPVEATADQVSRLPRLLLRLRSPRWLSGFVELDRTLALLVDLSLLARDALPAPAAAPKRSS